VIAGFKLEDLVYPEAGRPPRRPEGLPESDYAVMLTVAEWMATALDNRHRAADDWLPTLSEAFLGVSEGAQLAAQVLGTARRGLSRVEEVSSNPWEALQEQIHQIRRDAGTARLHRPEPAREVHSGGQLRIMTMHASKGAEFGAVWIPGLGSNKSNRGQFPGHPEQAFSPDTRKLMAESALAAVKFRSVETLRQDAAWELVRERLRLLYVAITRAERELHVSAASASGQGLSDPVRHLARALDPEAP
jgi:ATP-dependent exoDNAse (exonuclease V) beta subunit